MAMATAVLFFVSLLLHELAHSLVATSNDLPVKEITLFALGGVSQIEKNPPSAKIEFWMAFVGPLTSAVIGAFAWRCARVSGDPAPNPWMAMLLWLGYINLSLAGFNLLPGYPLDGGRVLRALIWWKTGDADRSTQSRRESRPGGRFRVHRASEFSVLSAAPVSEVCGSPSSDGFCCKRRGKAIVQVGLGARAGGRAGGGCDDAGLPHGGWLVECPELRGAGTASHRAALFYRGG